jgi:hypothetical protein
MRLRCRNILPIAAILGALAAVPAQASLLITIDKSSQRMIVAKDDLPLYDWPVSTGQRDYDTPAGLYQPFRMEADHFSREWDDAPMPHSIFFTQIGHAIHGSFETRRLGRPASHGCVRLKPENAAILFNLVRAEKMANTRVLLTGTIPGGAGTPPHVLGADPYAGDEALAGWSPPAPIVDGGPAPHAVTRGARKSQTQRVHYYRRPDFATIFGARRNER